MYMQDMITICKSDDDKFIVCIRKEKKNKKGDTMPMEMSTEKTYVADSVEDIGEILSKHIPGMSKGETEEEGYEEEFKKGMK